LPQPTASQLALKAICRPSPIALTIRPAIARTSFSRIRTNTCASLPLFTLSTHRMVRSTSPLSTRSRTLNQSPRRKALVLTPTISSLVRGGSTRTCGTVLKLVKVTWLRYLPQRIQNRLLPRPTAKETGPGPSGQQSYKQSGKGTVQQQTHRPEVLRNPRLHETIMLVFQTKPGNQSKYDERFHHTDHPSPLDCPVSSQQAELDSLRHTPSIRKVPIITIEESGSLSPATNPAT